jgi:hypothetical protein
MSEFVFDVDEMVLETDVLTGEQAGLITGMGYADYKAEGSGGSGGSGTPTGPAAEVVTIF